MKNKLLSLSLVLMTAVGVLSSESVLAQDKTVINDAEVAFNSNDWATAVKNYKQLTESKPENPYYHSQLGYCYLQIGKKDLAVQELKKAESLYTGKQKAKKPIAQTSQLYLASALRQSDNVNEALNVLNPLKENVKKKDLKAKVQQEIELCNYSVESKANPKDWVALNLGAFVNGSEANNSPVVTKSGNELYYTSRKKIEGHEMEDDNAYDENIFKCTRDNTTGTFVDPQPLNSNINLVGTHISVLSISNDGNEMYIYNDEMNGTIMVSKRQGNSWGEPVELNSNINTNYRETHADISKDGSKLYFTSNRPGGYGGLDLYVSERVDGEWGPAVNLGSVINTDQDEEGAYIADDGTLYFSSKGHKGMGGYDMFKSTGDLTNWSEPENLGYPVNTCADEVFMSRTSDGKIYFSSTRANGMGASDLYVFGPSALMKTDATILNAKVEDCSKEYYKGLIKVRDNSTGEDFEYNPDNITGEYKINTYRGHNYTLTAYKNGSEVFSEIFDVAFDASPEQDYKTVKLDPGVECPQEIFVSGDQNAPNVDESKYDYTIEIHDIYFDFADDKMIISSDEDLDKLADYLNENTTAKIQIIGYCDSEGLAFFNYGLGLKRANAAVDYLKKKKVNVASQVVAVSCGEENPMAYNFYNGAIDKEATKYNRRLEFEVMKQGAKTLLIRPIQSIPNRLKNPNYKGSGYKKQAGYPETKI